MSRVSYGENVWRVNDSLGDWLIFRNACEDDDYWVRREVFAPTEVVGTLPS